MVLKKESSMTDSKKQRGAVLPMALVLLVIVTLAGFSSVSTSNLRNQMVINQMRYIQLEQASQNVAARLLHDYPNNISKNNDALDLAGQNIEIISEHDACIAVQRTNQTAQSVDGATVAGIKKGHNDKGTKTNFTVDINDELKETKYFEAKKRVWNTGHPHLKSEPDWQAKLASGGSPEIVSLYIKGKFGINNKDKPDQTAHCASDFSSNNGGRIFHTGNNSSRCDTWPPNVEVYKITWNEMKSSGPIAGVTNGGSTGLGFNYIADVYKISELLITAKDTENGAEVSFTTGIKSHKAAENLFVLNEEFPNCIPSSFSDIEAFRDDVTSSDDMLPSPGDFRVLYARQNVGD